MISKKIGRTKLELYSGIDELTAERYHKFNLYCLLSVGIGSDVESVNKHFSQIYQALQKKDFDRLKILFENYYLNLNYIIEGVDVETTAFACLVHSINGKVQEDISDENLIKISKKIGASVKRSKVLNIFYEIKKKLKRKSTYISPETIAKEKQRFIMDSLKDVLTSY